MRYQVLATDYDGTLAHNGRVDDATLQALGKLLATGRKLVLVTGRELPDLLEIFPRIDLFEWVVAENGALLYKPSTKEEQPLAEPPPAKFIKALKKRGVERISVGRVIVATWEPHQNDVLETIREQGLEMQVIFNKGAVMVLPAGVNKATGLAAALKLMKLSPHNAVGVGDAENDHALLQSCEFSFAVANALPAVKESADFVTKADHGAGVAELIDKLVGNDLQDLDPRIAHHHLPLGTCEGEEVALPSYSPSVLICGPSASGKSTVATTVLEAIAAQKYQYCIVDPEGDYESLEDTLVLGGPQAAPNADDIIKALQNPETNVVVSMTGMAIPDRPPFFLELLPKLLKMRAETGRPHWLILDEVHHLMPAEWQPPTNLLPDPWHNVLMITVHPEMLAKPLLERIGTLLAVGSDAGDTLKAFASAAGEKLGRFKSPELQKGEVLWWTKAAKGAPKTVAIHPSTSDRRRHRRKYSEGSLPPERSFYFRGPEDKLNIRAQNLMMFLQIGDGVDDDTWLHHVTNGDIANWFKVGIKDENLAAEAMEIAKSSGDDPVVSRQLIRQAVERDYTLPAAGPLPVPGAG